MKPPAAGDPSHPGRRSAGVQRGYRCLLHRGIITRLTPYLLLSLPFLIRLNALRGSIIPEDPGSYLRLLAWEFPLLVSLFALMEWRRRLLSRVGRFVALVTTAVLWTLLLADAVVFEIFGLRLTFPEVVRYGTSVREVLAFAGLPLLLVGGVVLILVLSSLRRWRAAETDGGAATPGGRGIQARHPGNGPSLAFPFISVVAFIAAASMVPQDDSDLYSWAYQNWVSLNTQNDLFTPYSEEFADSIRSIDNLDPPCPHPNHAAGDSGGKTDIVMVLLESFSSGFSPLYGGAESHLPELERISREGLYFTRFLANGFTTEHGLIATLGSMLPVFPADVDARSLAGYVAFSGFYGPRSSVAACVNRLGYHTEFLTSGNLSFTDKGGWLRSLGFVSVEGHEGAHYEGLARGLFDAVSDSVLYDRALHRVEELRDGGKPFFLVVEGVDSHGPYRGGEGLDRALEAADADLGQFYDGLEAMGFLDSGLLVLVSDHRPQVPLTTKERDALGPEAAARVPAVLVGRGIPPREDTFPRHQLDVLPTIVHYLTGERPGGSSHHRASMLEPPPPRCLPWLNAGRRDEVLALCPEGFTRVRLNGEETRVLETVPSSHTESLIAAIHRARIAGVERGRPERGSREERGGGV